MQNMPTLKLCLQLAILMLAVAIIVWVWVDPPMTDYQFLIVQNRDDKPLGDDYPTIWVEHLPGDAKQAVGRIPDTPQGRNGEYPFNLVWSGYRKSEYREIVYLGDGHWVYSGETTARASYLIPVVAFAGLLLWIVRSKLPPYPSCLASQRKRQDRVTKKV